MKQCKNYDLPDCFGCRYKNGWCLFENFLNAKFLYNENYIKNQELFLMLISTHEDHIQHLRKIIQLRQPQNLHILDKILLLK